MRKDLLILQAALAAATDLCTDVLGFPMSAVLEDQAPVTGREFVSVALLSEDVAMQIGLAADRAVFTEIARPMLGVGPDEVVAQQDVIDAVSEAVNIIAGNFKTHINATYPSLKLGLPLLTVDNSKNEHAKGQTFMRIPLVMGDLRSSLIVVAKDSRGEL